MIQDLISYHVMGQSDEILATVRLQGVSSAFESIVLVDGGVVTVLATESETFEVAVGDVRTVSTVELVGALGPNEGAFRLQFSDGTEGIFLVLVPEPGSGVLVALGTLALVVRRRGASRAPRSTRPSAGGAR